MAPADRAEPPEDEPRAGRVAEPHRTGPPVSDRLRWLPTALLVSTALALVSFGLLAAAVSLEWDPVVSLDERIVEEVHEVVRRSPALVDALTAVTFLGSSAALYPVTAVAAWAAWTHDRPRLAIVVVAAAVSGGLCNHVVKDLVGRTRPVLDDPVAVGGGPSFPSGHAMNSTIVLGAAALVAGALIARHHRLLVAVAATLAVVIGATRVALGVHYPSDVAAGWALGFVWLVGWVVLLVGRPPRPERAGIRTARPPPPPHG